MADEDGDPIDELTLVRARVGVVEREILRAARAAAGDGEVVQRAIRDCDPGAVGRALGGAWANAARAYERGRDLAAQGRVGAAQEALQAAQDALRDVQGAGS